MQVAHLLLDLFNSVTDSLDANMASVQDPKAKQTKVKITNTLLYGVFVSQKSYLIGIRNLAKREHAEMLVTRITEHILPQELIDIVIDYLYEMEKDTVRSKWSSKISMHDQNVEKFEEIMYDCPAFRAASDKIVSLECLHHLSNNSTADKPPLSLPHPSDQPA